MATSRITLPALAVTFIAGLVALHDLQNPTRLLFRTNILVTLLAYDRRGSRTGWQSLAFAFVCGLALLLTLFYPLGCLVSSLSSPISYPRSGWLVGTAAFWFIDRARMDARHAASFPGYSQPSAAQAVPSIIQRLPMQPRLPRRARAGAAHIYAGSCPRAPLRSPRCRPRRPPNLRRHR